MADTIDVLMDAAEAGIRQKGYNAVSFRELADDLGIKSASVHYYFRKKEDLGLALLQRYSTRFFDLLDEQANNDTSPRDKLAVFCAAYRSALVQSDSLCLCGILGAESCGLPVSMSEGVKGFFEANVAWLESAFPSQWSVAEKRARAFQCVATLQGAMMLATSLNDTKVFDHSVQNLSSDLFGQE